MAGVYDLADLITFGERFGPGGNPASGGGDVGFHMGTVTEWDSSTGENVLMVAGGTVSNVPVLSTADSIMLAPGDTVGLIRFKSTYFILGRIAAPGGGAALQTRQAFTAAEVSTTNGSYTDLGGPVASDVYVGTSRRAMVFVSSLMATGNAWAQATVTVSGASSISADANNNASAQLGAFDIGDTSSNGRVYISGVATSVQVFDASNGLNAGLNTFRMVYRRHTDPQFTPLGAAVFGRRRLVVLPF